MRPHGAKALRLAGALLLALTLPSGCRVPGSSASPIRLTDLAPVTRAGDAMAAVRLDVPTTPVRLGPADRIELEIAGESGSRRTVTVGPDGKIYYHLLAGLDVWGLTLAEVQSQIERELSRYLREPKVVLTLRAAESRRVWLLGAMQRPGRYALTAPLTLLEAIAQAGERTDSPAPTATADPPARAELERAFLLRQGRCVPVDFQRLLGAADSSQNVYLEPDDFVYVPPAEPLAVYVLGAVIQPQRVAYDAETTVGSALAQARGPQPEAYLDQVVLLRGPLDRPAVALLNLKAIQLGRAPDIRLEPRDLIYVPFSPLPAVDQTAELVVNTFARMMAANEAARPDR